VPRLRLRESRATWWGGRRPSGPSLSAREPFTRTLDPSCQTRRTAWVRRCCFMPAGPFHRSRRGLPPRGAENAKRPASTWGGGALEPSSARSGCGDLPPQRTTSRELCLILPIPPATDGRPRNAAEPVTAVQAAEPGPEGRREDPTRSERSIGRPRRRHRRTRLRRGPGRQRRGGGHGRAMHPEGGGEREGHHSVFRSVSQWFGSSCSYGRSAAADSAQTKTGGASDRPVSEAIPSRRPAPEDVVLRRRLGTRLPFRAPNSIVPLARRQGAR